MVKSPHTLAATALLLLYASSTAALQSARRVPRTLLFEPTAPTRIQFIGGIGIPVEDLFFESVTSGYVFKTEYYLPVNASDWYRTALTPINVNGKRSVNVRYPQMDGDDVNESASYARAAGANFKSQHKNASIYRWIIYSAIESVLQRAGLPGRECMLRSICEHAAVPLHYTSGILAEILHIILTPSSSHDDLVRAAHKAYLRAEVVGRTGGDCAEVFAGCVKSPIDQITAVFDLGVDT